jgi:uncharacterized protein
VRAREACGAGKVVYAERLEVAGVGKVLGAQKVASGRNEGHAGPVSSLRATLHDFVGFGHYPEQQMTLVDTVKQDLATAMRAGEKDRVGALRLVLSELQKAAKDGSADELAVLRRERKRRLESAAAFRDAGRPELADGEAAEARMIETYLPAQLGDDELRAIVAAAVAETAAQSPKDMGQVMKAAMPTVDGRADGKRVSALVREALGS